MCYAGADAHRLLSETPEVRQQVLERFNEDKSLNKKPKKLCQYKTEILKEQAQSNIEKAILLTQRSAFHVGDSRNANNFSIEISESLLVQPGETWQLGRHKLSCCDSSTWNPPYAKLAFADPPYNCGIAEWDFHFEWKHDWLINKADLVLVTPGDESLAGFLKKTEMPYRCTIAHWIKNGMSKGAMGYGNHILGLVFCSESTPYKVTGVRNQSFSTALATGVVSSTSENVKPVYKYKAVYGTSSETFSRATNYLKCWSELAALKYATEQDTWVLSDGSFTSINFEMGKWASVMPKEGDISRDFVESELLTDLFIESIKSEDSDWFTVFGDRKLNKVISVGKRGISKYYSTNVIKDFEMEDTAFLPSDKFILGTVLQANEFTKP